MIKFASVDIESSLVVSLNLEPCFEINNRMHKTSKYRQNNKPKQNVIFNENIQL